MIARAWADLRDAARRLRAAKGFTLFAMLTLGVAIGLNVLAFTAFDAVALHTLEVREPSMLRRAVRDAQGPFTLDEVTDLRGSIGVPLAGVSDVMPVTERMMGPMTAAFALPGLFELLGLSPSRGHLVIGAEPRRMPSLVMSHQLWASRFHSDVTIVGKRLVVNDIVVRVAGVTPPTFTGTGASPIVPDLWLPAELMSRVIGDEQGDASGAHVFKALVRLTSASQEREVSDALSMVARSPIRLRPVSLMDAADTPEFRRTTVAVLSAFALVLLVACINLAMLMRARVEARRKDIAIRISLGATPRRITLQLLGESVLVGLGGGVIALGIVGAVVRFGWSALLEVLAHQSKMEGLSIAIAPAVDGRVILYTLGVATIAGVVSGLGAARSGAAIDANLVFAPRRTLRGGARRLGVRRLLLVLQVASSIALLAMGTVIARGDTLMIGRESAEITFPVVPMVAAFALGGIALMLALSGSVGLLTYAVGARSREFAIRTLMGASRSGLSWLALQHELRAIMCGGVLGSVVVLLVTRELSVLWTTLVVVGGIMTAGTVAPLRRIAHSARHPAAHRA